MPHVRKDFVGSTFGRLEVVECLGKPNGRKYTYRCRCACGNIIDIGVDSLRTGNSNSCGCLHRERVTKHGDSKSLTYKSWICMNHRCKSASHISHHRYGGRGIKVCERWSSYENFLADMGERPSVKHSIERKNNNGDYTPENCKWATMVEQQNNRNDNIMVEFKGVRHTLRVWCRILELDHRIVRGRLMAAGATFESVINKLRS